MLILPNLSLYIHIPWCVKKCPYCDFNSHVLVEEIPADQYIQHLLNDLRLDIPLTSNRKIDTIFIGGGTPSLLHVKNIQYLLDGVRESLELSQNAEITIEANPGALEVDRFHGYKNAGVNRISLGVQSFQEDSLTQLGRMYSAHEVETAVHTLTSLDLRSFNIDLMHGLPNQSQKKALYDLRKAIALNPPHVSWYQLMIEPCTLFSATVPQLPDEDELWRIFNTGHKLLRVSGYKQYEISSYAKPNYACIHNLNYWRFGDYIGIGCGAHGKLTQLNGSIIRTSKTRHPRKFMSGHYLCKRFAVPNCSKPLEFFMNRFRLLEAIPRNEYAYYTGLSEDSIRSPIEIAIKKGFLIETDKFWKVTKQGQLLLNCMLELFLTD
ncbi:Oxygen-independent coproporphyrinogen-III oxidase-like protein YggW [Candidatus Erwinia haradaeae]|uniref:Heme chaperone HemW n=1 Tax=Candidatus Erwinia haradaeae TaxID=1922217 RepID=A0A451DM18_9GAMM|nr:radical SAM family heme chaperone HemW [Candidatus Erwinia haradaeae]VFP87775.1 Oxygen-independent coproporphyrinogen-III oxidase-like protein YggW [Candidatus Erwinia haradaeae]